MAASVIGAVVTTVLLIEGRFDSGTVCLWTGLGDLDWNGQTWTGAGDILGVSFARETTEMSADGASVTLTGIKSALIALALTEDYQDRPILIRLALLSADPIGDFSSDFSSDFYRPLASGNVMADPIVLFAGRMDVMEIEEGGDTARFTISAENRLVDLRRVRERRFTPEDQKLTYPGDLGLDFIPVLQDAEIVWGRTG